MSETLPSADRTLQAPSTLGGALPALWTLGQRRALLASQALTVVVLVIAWAGAEDATTLRSQIPWLNLAVVAAAVGAIANVSWLIAGRRSVGRMRLGLVPDVHGTPDALPVTEDPSTWLWLPGTRRAHRPGCDLVAGKPAVRVERDLIAFERLERCEFCSEVS